MWQSDDRIEVVRVSAEIELNEWTLCQAFAAKLRVIILRAIT